ncbi:MAG: hypothetical protein LUQ36_00175 [Methanoregula sp.]|nr:hypothetical protein [Methanoregula sp.]
MTTTVLISDFAHGISANPAIAWYEGKMALLPSDAAEFKEVVESPTRTRVTVKE